MDREVKKLNYFLILSFSILQFIFTISMIILCIIYKYYLVFFQMSNWSYLLSIIYLFSISICDTNLYCFSSTKLENYYLFIKNRFSDIVFPYSFMVFIISWSVYLLGLIFGIQTFLKSDQTIGIEHIIINFNIHLCITVMLVVELFLNGRKKVKLNWFSGTTNIAIFIAYAIFVWISKFAFDCNAYVFMEELTAGGMFFVGFVVLVLLVACYFVYFALANKINRMSRRVIESGEDNGLLRKEDMNE